MNSEASFLMEIHVCTFNGASTLSMCLESIISQLSPSIKLAVLDDASTDHSRDIIIQVLSKVPSSFYRIVCLSENTGLAQAKNILAQASTAKYVAYIDDDDIALPGRFSTQLKFLIDNSTVDVLGGYAYEIPSFILERGQPSDLSKYRILRRPITHESIIGGLWRNPLIHPTVAIKLSALRKVCGYNPELRTSQDYDLWFRLNNADARFSNLPIPLIVYRKSTVKKYKPIAYLRTLKVARVHLNKKNLKSRIQLLIMTIRVYFKVLLCFISNHLFSR